MRRVPGCRAYGPTRRTSPSSSPTCRRYAILPFVNRRMDARANGHSTTSLQTSAKAKMVETFDDGQDHETQGEMLELQSRRRQEAEEALTQAQADMQEAQRVGDKQADTIDALREKVRIDPE